MRPGLVLLATSLGVLIAQVDTSVVTLAVKRIGADLDATVSGMQWTVDLYNLVYAAFLLVGGALGDVYGRRRVFAWGIGLFALGSVVCAAAPGMPVLLAGRALTGLGAALELPMSLALLALAYPEPRARQQALGIWASCNGLAFVVGPTLGGLLVELAGWRSIFYLILPPCAAALLLARRSVPESADRGGRSLALAVPFSLFRSRPFSASLAVAGLMTFGMYGMLFLLPLYFQSLRGDSALMTGVRLLPLSVSFVLVSQLSGRIVPAIGARAAMACGMAAMGAGEMALALASATTSHWLIGAGMVVVGIGLGLNTAPVNSVAVASVPRERSGVASGLLNTARMVGATLGVAVLGAVFAHFAGQQLAAEGFLPGLRAALGIGGAAELAGAAIALAFVGRGDG
jgi:MFS family permease